MEEFEVYSVIQSRVLLAGSDEGRQQMARDSSIRKGLELEHLEAQLGSPSLLYSDQPVDFEAMTPEQFNAWQRSQPGFNENDMW